MHDQRSYKHFTSVQYDSTDKPHFEVHVFTLRMINFALRCHVLNLRLRFGVRYLNSDLDRYYTAESILFLLMERPRMAVYFGKPAIIAEKAQEIEVTKILNFALFVV